MATAVKLATGAEMPLLGLGTSQLKPDEAYDAVYHAIDVGIRHFDTAFAFQNEDGVGLAVKNKIKEKKIKREELFIATKLHVQFHGEEGVKEGLDRTLRNLDLEYIDLFVVQFPVPMARDEDRLFPSKEGKPLTIEVDHLETWKGMEAALESGKVKAIGLSNFNSKQMQRIIDGCSVKPHVLQVECHPHFPQHDLHKFCKKNGIAMASFIPFGAEIARRTAANKDKSTSEGPLTDAKVSSIAEAHGKTTSQVCLQYLIQRGIVALPRGTSKESVESYFEALNFSLTDSELSTLDRLGVNKRSFDAPFMKKHPEYPFSEAF